MPGEVNINPEFVTTPIKEIPTVSIIKLSSATDSLFQMHRCRELSSAENKSLFTEAKKLTGLREEDKNIITSSPIFIRTLDKLRDGIAILSQKLQGSGVLSKDRTLTVADPIVCTVGKNAAGETTSAMVAMKVEDTTPNGEVVWVYQTVEMVLKPDTANLEIINHDGKKFIHIVKDNRGNPVLPSAGEAADENGKEPIYVSWGGTNRRTLISQKEISLDSSEFKVQRERGELLSIAELVGTTEDLITATMAMSLAEPEDAKAIAQALKERKIRREQEQAKKSLVRETQVVIGNDLPNNAVKFAPFKEIVNRFPGALGVVCSNSLTLKGQEEPLFAQVVGIVVEGKDGKKEIKQIDPILARKDSVAAGVVLMDGEDNRYLVTVAELRAAVGRVDAQQVAAGCTGDSGELSMDQIAIKEILEEVGAQFPAGLEFLASYLASPNTTEGLGLYMVKGDKSKVQEGKTLGHDAGEKTLVHSHQISKNMSDPVFIGDPPDAKTAFLAYAARIGLMDALQNA